MKPAIDPLAALQDAFDEDVIYRGETFRGEQTIYVAAPHIVEVATYLRDTPGLKYNYLSDITGVDYLDYDEKRDPDDPRFGVCYHLYSMNYNRRLRLKVLWDEGDDPVPSLVDVWPSANWEEREAYDMFGIRFNGHPDLRRILMPPEWEGYPQRKDYPLGYEQVQFTFNFDEVEKHKPYAKK